MRRREVLTLIGGAAAAWPLVVGAQQAGKLPTIGYLGGGPISQRSWVDAFVQRLRELGWIDGRTIAIEYRWGEDAQSAMPTSRTSLSGARST
jgi:putative tryptophan/tyrosine transport system substrate-binding protein